MAIELLPIGRIEFRSNVRERLVEEEHVALAQSIKASGILVPLLGYREGDAIVADARPHRLDSAQRAEKVQAKATI